MSCGEHDDFHAAMAYSMALQVDKEFMKQMQQMTQPLMNAISPYPGAVGANYGPGSYQQSAGTSFPPPAYYQNGTITTATTGTGGLTIGSGTNGYLASDNTGNLSWNGNPLGYNYGTKPSVKNLTDMLKDDVVKKIVLCKSKEECKEEYGKHGLEIYESLLKEILDAGIKSEETFLAELSKEQGKFNTLKDYLATRYKDDKDLQHILFNL